MATIKTATVTFRIHPAVKEALCAAAARERRSIANIEEAGLADGAMEDLLASHAFELSRLRREDFGRFVEARRLCLVARIERAMVKQVNLAGEQEEYEGAEAESFAN